MKDGVNIGHSESILRIESVKKEDKGMYQVHLPMFFLAQNMLCKAFHNFFVVFRMAFH